MRISLLSRFFSAALLLAACTGGPTAEKVKLLTDPDGDGFMTSEGCAVSPGVPTDPPVVGIPEDSPCYAIDNEEGCLSDATCTWVSVGAPCEQGANCVSGYCQPNFDSQGGGGSVEPGCGGGDPAPIEPQPAPMEPGPAPVPSDDCVIYPNPGGCTFVEWSESTTTEVDAEGNVISETVEVCTQCLDEQGSPIGDRQCSSSGTVEPVICNEIASGDPSQHCWECSSPNGEFLYASCAVEPFTCYSDGDCNTGEICVFVPFTCPEGALCAEVQSGFCQAAPVEDPCASYTEEASCAADAACEWMGLGAPCQEGEDCPSGACVIRPSCDLPLPEPQPAPAHP